MSKPKPLKQNRVFQLIRICDIRLRRRRSCCGGGVKRTKSVGESRFVEAEKWENVRDFGDSEEGRR